MRRLDSHSASDHQKPMRESQTVPCDVLALVSENTDEPLPFGARHSQPLRRLVTIPGTLDIYVMKHPRIAIEKYAVGPSSISHDLPKSRTISDQSPSIPRDHDPHPHTL